MHKQINRSAKRLRRGESRARGPEMPEEQARMRAGRAGETRAVIVSPTGTRHRPIKRKIRRVAKSRAKSPSMGRAKEMRK